MSLLEEWNLDDALAVAKRDGEELGMREGKKQKALEIARNLRANGMGVNEIAELTGLTVDDVLRL
jgi:predicted transposase/invertase (TIGR01784 family)